MVFANEPEVRQIKPQSPGKMKRNTGMNQWVYFSRFFKKHLFRLFPIFEQIQALRNAQAALKAKRDGGLDALMDSIYQDVSFFGQINKIKKKLSINTRKLRHRSN